LKSGQVAVGRNRGAFSKPAWKRERSGAEEGKCIIWPSSQGVMLSEIGMPVDVTVVNFWCVAKAVLRLNTSAG
jgi:hypothetical protein